MGRTKRNAKSFADHVHEKAKKIENLCVLHRIGNTSRLIANTYKNYYIIILRILMTKCNLSNLFNIKRFMFLNNCSKIFD